MDLIYQLEALNPTPDATNVNTIGELLELHPTFLGANDLELVLRNFPLIPGLRSQLHGVEGGINHSPPPPIRQQCLP